MAIFNFIYDSGFVGWCIIAVGIGAVALIVERTMTLYGKYKLNSTEFMNRVHKLVLEKKVDEAMVLCTQAGDHPLPKAFKTILEKADRDDNTIFQAHDIAMAENAPMLSRRIHYLSMLANVATLMGLLGTIHGLILSFQAVASADPAQKQALLASGIAVSMYTTALGLAVAIPAMIAYSFLVSRQNHLVEDLTEKCGKLAELLTTAHIATLARQSLFPDSLRKEAFADRLPPTQSRVS